MDADVLGVEEQSSDSSYKRKKSDLLTSYLMHYFLKNDPINRLVNKLGLFE